MRRILVVAAFAAGLIVLGGMNAANTAATATHEVASVEASGVSCDLTSCEPCPGPCPLPCSVAAADEAVVGEVQAN